MGRKFHLFLFILVLFFPSISHGQNCFGYQKSHCFPPESKFTYSYNDVSVGFLFSSGEQRDIPFRFYNGKDYRITLCADSVFQDVIRFTILSDDSKTLYSNESHQYSLNAEFSSNKTQDVILRIEAPEASKGLSDTVSYKGCIGILIEDMNSIKTGF